MFKLFSGTASTKLTQEVSQILQIPVSKAEVVRFDNSEVKVTILEDVRDASCVIVQSTSNPTDTHLMELAFFADALRRSGAKKIVAFIPYFGYARQNEQHRPGECVSMNVVVKLLESMGIDEMKVFTLHEEASEGIFSVPFEDISALDLMAKNIVETRLIASLPTDIAIATPDQEGVERAQKFANILADLLHAEQNAIEIVVTEKNRDLQHTHQSEAVNLFGNVTDKTVIIVDDIVTSGGTLINSANLCLERGAKNVYAAIVHPDFSPTAPQKLQESKIEKIFTTNSIELTDQEKFPKLQTISLAPLLAGKLRDIV